MPINDWKRVDAGLFHHFHQSWAVNLAEGLNAGILPSGYFALVEQKGLGFEPDVMTLGSRPGQNRPVVSGGGIAVVDHPPQTRHVSELSDDQSYARRANRVGVRHSGGVLVAVVEIVSPGNKDRTQSVRAFADKTLEFLANGVHVLVLDLFPPTPRDPHGIHRVIWDEVREDDYLPPADKPLTLASYVGAPSYTAYVEAAAVGDPVPAMPVFLDEDTYVNAPLEETYLRTWQKCPRQFREQVENPTA